MKNYPFSSYSSEGAYKWYTLVYFLIMMCKNLLLYSYKIYKQTIHTENTRKKWCEREFLLKSFSLLNFAKKNFFSSLISSVLFIFCKLATFALWNDVGSWSCCHCRLNLYKSSALKKKKLAVFNFQFLFFFSFLFKIYLSSLT